MFNSAAGLEDVWVSGIAAAFTGNFGSRVLPSRPDHSVPEVKVLGKGSLKNWVGPELVPVLWSR